MSEQELLINIEALLFALGRPLSRSELIKETRVSAGEIENAIAKLAAKADGGVVLVDDGRLVELRAAPQAAGLIERVRKDEYGRDVGRAGLEALAAVLYRGPLTRAEIDFIRGVNSSQTLRTLAMRGLVRKVPNPKDERSFLYEPTTDLLAHLGTLRQSDLPQYAEVREKLRALEAAYRDKEAEVARETPL